MKTPLPKTSRQWEIYGLYKRFPELVKYNRLLEFIYLTKSEKKVFGMDYNQLRLYLAQCSVSMNDFLDATPIETIAREGRLVREYMDFFGNLDENIKKQRMEEEIRYRQKYSPNQMSVFNE